MKALLESEDKMTPEEVFAEARKNGATYKEAARFRDIVIDAITLEREACAKVCERSDRYRGDYFAAKIRMRSNVGDNPPSVSEGRVD